MNTLESPNDHIEVEGDIETNGAETKLHQINIQDLLAMPKEERKQALDKFDEYNIFFSLSQVQELWKRREELDEEMFHLMIASVRGGHNNSPPKYPGVCPFSGLKADANASGWDGSTWLDASTFDMHHSVAKDLVKLAVRVGAGTAALTIIDEGKKSLFGHHVRRYGANHDEGDHNNYAFIHITDRIGATEEKTAENERVYEKLLKDEIMLDSDDELVEIELKIETLENVREIKLEIRQKTRETLAEGIAS